MKGNENLRQGIGVRDRRLPLRKRRMSRIAKGLRIRCNKRSRTIAKGDGLLRMDAVMRKPIDIDSKHSRAIVREIGKGLRESVKEDQELPANLKAQIERLRQSEGEAQQNAPRTNPRRP
jgi:hypothetical protein